MGYTASLTFTDDIEVVHTQSCKVGTFDEGAEALHKMLLQLMLTWPDYNPYGIKVDASVVSDDQDFGTHTSLSLGCNHVQVV